MGTFIRGAGDLRLGTRKAGGVSSLLTGLANYWPMQETSGTRADIIGSANLTDNNTVMSGTGHVQSNAALFVTANSEFLSRAAMTWTATSGLTIACWFKLTVNVSYNFIIGSVAGYVSGNTHISVGRGATNDTYLTTNTEADPWARITGTNYRDGSWHFLAAWYDPSGGATLNIQIDNGTVTIGTVGAVVPTPGSILNVGLFGGGTYYLDGSLEQLGIWQRVLTAPERSSLYAGGAGIAYPF